MPDLQDIIANGALLRRSGAGSLEDVTPAELAADSAFTGAYVGKLTGLATGAPAATANTSVLNAAIAALPATGGTLIIPAGQYYFDGEINAENTRTVTIRSTGGGTRVSTAAVAFVYTGTGSRFINARSSHGFALAGLSLQYTASGFTGSLVDLSHSAAATDSAYADIDSCTFLGVNAAGQTAILVNLDKAIASSVHGCTFTGAGTAIRGRASSVSYSNGITIDAECLFIDQAVMPIKNAGQAWTVDSCVFEPRKDGSAGAYAFDSGCSSNGLTIKGCWFGDATNGGVWITWSGNGLNLEGNYIAGNATATAVLFTTSSNSGVTIVGNDFQTFSKGIDFGATTGSSLFLAANNYTSVTTRLAGTMPTNLFDFNAGKFRFGNAEFTLTATGSTHGVIADALTAGDTALSVRGGLGLRVVAGGGGSEKLQIDDALPIQLGSSIGTAGKILRAAGSPEGAVTANVGSMFLRSDGGASTTLYVKESGTGNTGWVAK